jgi:hypothetical protein
LFVCALQRSGGAQQLGAWRATMQRRTLHAVRCALHRARRLPCVACCMCDARTRSLPTIVPFTWSIPSLRNVSATLMAFSFSI